MINFTSFGKIPRLYAYTKGIVITEKIDGTNGAVRINRLEDEADKPRGQVLVDNGDGIYAVAAQSRNRDLMMEPVHFSEAEDNWRKRDNAGFAAWVWENAYGLVRDLGEGLHFGEWWGQGINRAYGLDHKRFSLFNTERWKGAVLEVPQLGVVPILYEGQFDEAQIEIAERQLLEEGSRAAPGFTRPEGLMMFHQASNHLYKIPFDQTPKGKAA